MDPTAAQRWARTRDLLYAALDLAPSERAAYLDRECADDPALRAELESLIAASEQPAWIDKPILGERQTQKPPKPGETFRHYTVVEEIGRGGMGVVYKAFDTRIGRAVALKVMLTLMGSDSDRRRFLREARVASALQHPGVVTIYEFDSVGELDYIAMEYVEGRTLGAILDKDSAERTTLLTYAKQIAAALGSAHAAGIVHRDLKPGNIMVTTAGKVKLLDFGIARRNEPIGATDETRTQLTMTGMQVGTPAYMAPEQILGESVDHRADIFAFGVLLYHMVTGKRPFEHPTVQRTYMAILQDEPALPPGISRSLGELIRGCMKKKREDRVQSMGEVVARIERILVEPPVRTSRRAIVAAATLAVAALGAVIVFRPEDRRVALTYSLEVQRMRDDQPLGDPYPADPSDPFQPGWRYRIRAAAARPGHFYLVREVAGRFRLVYPPVSGSSMLAGMLRTEWYPVTEAQHLWIVSSFEPQPRVAELLSSSDWQGATLARPVPDGTELSTSSSVAAHRLHLRYRSEAK